jgi:hypothetical protein
MIHAFLEDTNLKSLGCGETHKNMGVPPRFIGPVKFFGEGSEADFTGALNKSKIEI